MATYTVPTTGIYTSSRTGKRFRYPQGSIIDLATAVDLGVPGAALPPVESPLVTSIIDPHEGDTLFYAGGVWINAQPAPTGAAIEIASASTGTADGPALAFDHTIQPATNRRTAMFVAALGAQAANSNATIGNEDEDLESEFGQNSGTSPELSLGFYTRVAPPVGRYEIAAELRVGTTDAAAVVLNLTNAVQGANYQNIMYAGGTETSGTGPSGTLADTSQYGGGTVSAVSTGDVVLLAAAITPAQSVTLGEGFALVETLDLSDGNARMFVWSKTADDGEDTTYGFTMAEGATAVWLLVAFAAA